MNIQAVQNNQPAFGMKVTVRKSALNLLNKHNMMDEFTKTLPDIEALGKGKMTIAAEDKSLNTLVYKATKSTKKACGFAESSFDNSLELPYSEPVGFLDGAKAAIKDLAERLESKQKITKSETSKPAGEWDRMLPG